MVLIDAANVSGGGAILLQYLVDQLSERGLPYFVLKKPAVSLTAPAGQYADAQINLLNRQSMLRTYIQQVKPKTILCFGNFPPPFYTGVRTVTYFHNSHYLKGHDRRNFSRNHYLKRLLRRLYLQTNLDYSELFVVQIPVIREAFVKTFGVQGTRLQTLPFYNQERIEQIKAEEQEARVVKNRNAFIYASSSEPHKNHANLLKAWAVLHQRGFTPTLYLTISPNSPYTTPALLQQIDILKRKGVAIINKGSLPYDDLLRLTYSCSACIFPSVNETLGLGLVESYWMGNSVLAGRRPYLSDVVRPSADFDPHDPESIADAVVQYMTGSLPETELVINNQINEFIELLYPQKAQLTAKIDSQTVPSR
ncbi:glycosyltransferase [Spirosoma taeanense]|uniref:Glycosyltransferase n=1 Tax=Spirosoma taeanense TaxID=2735870 RepID=A0A6M5YB33_9BACT|nr:glycosyltransferase [Spirosoma taeanense]QJW91169.1 glycosyltransferase [Spirosoma taeanense]